MSITPWIYENNADSGSAIGFADAERVHTEQSEYQRIDIYRTREFGYVMALDDCWMVTSRENFLYHEMMSHPALLSHPKPSNVAIIGGGDCGTLKEVLRHAEVQSAIQIELDERVTRVAEQWFPELTESNDDERAELLFTDGIAWMQDAQPGSIDVLIVDSTDPVGPAAGLYDVDFFGACHASLADGGIMVQQSESPLLHADLIRTMHERLTQAGFVDVQTITFPQPCYPSGWWSATMARKGQPFGEIRSADALGEMRYYSTEMHRAALVLPPFLRRLIDHG